MDIYKYRFEKFKKIREDFLDDYDSFYRCAEEAYGDDSEKWYRTIIDVVSLKKEASKLYEKEEIDMENYQKILKFYKYCLDMVVIKFEEIENSRFINKYGKIEELKKNLVKDIDVLKFEQLLNLIKDYNKKQYEIKKYAKDKCFSMEIPCIKNYYEFFGLGIILISDQMNKLNSNKAQNKFISEDDIKKTLKYFYDTDEIDEVNRKRQITKYIRQKESGNEGEKSIDYALSWLDVSKYSCIEKRSIDKAGGKCIYLKNIAYRDEKQEYDNIVVSDRCVYNIEVKNFKGKIIIDDQQNWKRLLNNVEQGLENPIGQVKRHEKLLASFLPEGTFIESIICLSDANVIIEGINNSKVPVIKGDMLVAYIENKNEELSEQDIDFKAQCEKLIYDMML